MFFKEFPALPYPFYIGDKRSYALARNILLRVAFTDRINDQAFFTEYHIKDGERPEHIAYRLYGNSALHWIVMLANDIIDPYYGWYMSASTLEQNIQQRYQGMAVYFSDTFGGFTYNSEFYSGCTLSQGNLSSSITNYRDTFCEFTVSNPSFVSGTATVYVPSGATVAVSIRRALPLDRGVNYFRIERPTGSAEGASGAQQYPVVDPLSKQSADYEEYTAVLGNSLPPTTIGGASGATVEFWETHIGKYMGISGSAFNDYAVTNYMYEQEKNDSRRKIRLISPAFLDSVMKEFKSATSVVGE